MTATAAKIAEGANAKGLVTCLICGETDIHHIGKHLQTSGELGAAEPDVLMGEYRKKFPNALLTSPVYDKALQQHQEREKAAARERQLAQEAQAKVIPFARPGTVEKRPMYEVFGLELTDACRTAKRRNQTVGDVIQIDVLINHSPEDLEAVPAIDENYVFRVDELKDGLMSLALSDNTYIYGGHGTGKTTMAEQMLARTRRPYIRVQHTDTTEESHILGQMVVRDGATEFDYGPLPEAMINGWVYLADEYDVAHAGVLAVYQPVLEGNDLYIKEAPPSMRRVKPHPNFRFIATGNTNGSGDETGLYAGTKVGNAANYSRFGTSIRIDYPSADIEKQMIVKRVGIKDDVAGKLVDFAGRVREAYEKGEISLPISPRELLGAARKGVATGGRYRHGLDLNYVNRLGKGEAESVRQTAQRVFG
jgi:cobaltochelatase CobS